MCCGLQHFGRCKEQAAYLSILVFLVVTCPHSATTQKTNIFNAVKISTQKAHVLYGFRTGVIL